jgi:hypothetical protein
MSGQATWRYLHLGITFAGIPKSKELEPLITTLSGDWVRYGFNTWVLWTPLSATSVANSVRAALGAADQLLVVSVDIREKDGWLPEWIWNWLNKPRAPLGTQNQLIQPPITGMSNPLFPPR